MCPVCPDRQRPSAPSHAPASGRLAWPVEPLRRPSAASLAKAVSARPQSHRRRAASHGPASRLRARLIGPQGRRMSGLAGKRRHRSASIAGGCQRARMPGKTASRAERLVRYRQHSRANKQTYLQVSGELVEPRQNIQEHTPMSKINNGRASTRRASHVNIGRRNTARV
jgi:hypothetical protein